MKVGLSTSCIQHGRSGVAQYVFGLVHALLERSEQCDLTLFVLENDRAHFDFAAGRAQLVLVSERFRPPVSNILWHQLVLPKLVRAYSLEVVHIPSYRRMLWPRPCRLVATIHDLAPFRVAHKYDRKRMFYGRTVARRLAARQDQIIAVSQHTQQDILNFFKLPCQRLNVVHNGLDHSRFFPARAQNNDPLEFGAPFLLYVSRLEHPAKNHLRLIEAFEIFKTETNSNWRLVLVGSDWHGSPTIHDAIARSPFRQDIRTLGFVEEERLPKLYRAAKALVFPSLYEGFGFPPLEAMACGCPVLCSTRGALPEVVGGAAATFDPENVAALKSVLKRLACDDSWGRALRAAGLARARQFDWSATAEKTLAVYDAAVKGPAKTDSLPTQPAR